MRPAVYSGRCMVPPEWRSPLGLRFWQRTAIIAVTGAAGKDAAFGILCAHLPLIARDDGADGEAVPVGALAGEPRTEHTQPYPGTLGGAYGMPAAAPAGSEDGMAIGGIAEDTETARRMARRLHRLWPARGVRELARAGFIPPHLPAVYAWRRFAHGEHVYLIWPEGPFTPVAMFRTVQMHVRGQMRDQLVAARPW